MIGIFFIASDHLLFSCCSLISRAAPAMCYYAPKYPEPAGNGNVHWTANTITIIWQLAILLVFKFSIISPSAFYQPPLIKSDQKNSKSWSPGIICSVVNRNDLSKACTTVQGGDEVSFENYSLKPNANIG